MKDLYQCLDLTRAASQAEIKKSFRKLTSRFHPDKNPDDRAAEERYKEVCQAYDVLSDAERRQDYDEFGEMSLTQGFDREKARAYKSARGFGGAGYGGGAGFGGGGFPGGSGFQDFGDARSASFDDLISRLFGGESASNAGYARGPARGQDIGGSVTISLKDALLGTQVPVQISSEHQGPRKLDVKIPPGIADGAKLRLKGQGSPGRPPGDVVLTVQVKEGRYLKRDGHHLRMRLPVSAFEAYGGGAVDIPTPWGAVTLQLPAGSQSGQTLRLRGKGVRVKGEAKGDLFVTLQVMLPENQDPELLAALERLQAQSDARAKLPLLA